MNLTPKHMCAPQQFQITIKFDSREALASKERASESVWKYKALSLLSRGAITYYHYEFQQEVGNNLIDFPIFFFNLR